MRYPFYHAAFLVLLLMLFLFPGCGDDDDDSDDGSSESDDDDDDDDDDNDDNDNDDNDDDVDACWTDLAVGQKQQFATGLSGTEGIAFSPGGELFASNGSAIILVNPDGTYDVVSDAFTKAVGIAFSPEGDLFICEFGQSSLANPNDGAIYKMDAQYAVSLVAAGIPNPNFITYTPQGNFLVSDNMADVIFEVGQGGSLIEWLSPLDSPNGMVYNQARDALYVAGTFTTGNPVYRVNLDGQGAPIDSQVIANLDSLSLPDGIAMDEQGMIYVAENSIGKIVKVDPDTGDYEVVAGGMTTPASMAFGKGPDFDPCSIYVTELIGSHIWRVSLGVKGQPLVSE